MHGLLNIRGSLGIAISRQAECSSASLRPHATKRIWDYRFRSYGATEFQSKRILLSRSVCSSVSADIAVTSLKTPSMDDERFKTGWYRYLPLGVEPSAVISFAPEVDKQFALLEANPGNRHLRYDLTTLCLRSLRAPLTSDHEKCSVLLSVCQESLGILSKAEKFIEQLNAQLAKHMTQIQRLDIRIKMGEHKQKLVKNQWMSIPLMAAYAHFLMLDGQLQAAYETVHRANLVNQSLLYFQLGYAIERQHVMNQSVSDSAQPTGDAASTTTTSSSLVDPNHLLVSAAIMYCRSIAKFPTNTESLTNLAVLEWYHEVDTYSAMKIVESELEASLSKSKGYNAPVKRPHVRTKQSSMKRSIELLQRAIEVDTAQSNYVAHYHLGFILETAANEPEKAREHYSKALQINPDHMQSHSHLGSMLMDEKLYSKALHHFEQAKLLAPNQLLVYLNLANCLARLGSIEAAMKEMQKAIRREPTMPHLHYHLAMILVRAKRFEEAIASFERALQLHGLFPQHHFDTAPTYNVMVSVLREMAQKLITDGETIDDFERPAKMLARCLDLLPDGSSLFPVVLASLSFCLMKSNRPQAAYEAINEAIEKGGETFLVQFHQSQQNDSNPIVQAQLEQHFNSLEHTDALLQYLLPLASGREQTPITQSEASDSKNALEKKRTTKRKLTRSSKKVVAKKKKSRVHETAAETSRPLAASVEAIDSAPNFEEGDVVEQEDDFIETAIHSELTENKEQQLEMLLSHKAKLHYNIAFCLHYLGELQEAKSHLALAIESDPNCTADYVIPEAAPGADEASELRGEVEDIDGDEDFTQEKSPSAIYKEDDDVKTDSKVEHSSNREPVTSSSIRRASRALPYTSKGMEYQLDRLVHPPDGSEMTASTKVLLEFLGGLQEKYKDASLEALDAALMKGMKSGPVATRSAKSKRRRDKKYTIEASRRASHAGPDDGFDSPL